MILKREDIECLDFFEARRSNSELAIKCAELYAAKEMLGITHLDRVDFHPQGSTIIYATFFLPIPMGEKLYVVTHSILDEETQSTVRNILLDFFTGSRIFNAKGDLYVLILKVNNKIRNKKYVFKYDKGGREAIYYVHYTKWRSTYKSPYACFEVNSKNLKR